MNAVTRRLARMARCLWKCGRCGRELHPCAEYCPNCCPGGN